MADRRRRYKKYRSLLEKYSTRPSKRIFRDRPNPMDVYTDEEVFERYRFRRQTVYYILDLINNDSTQTVKNYALSPLLQLLVCLRFFATGAFHKLVGDSFSVSECTVGRCCRRITSALLKNRGSTISFPKGHKALQTKQQFQKIAGFPNVLGCIDGTFIKIIGPTENEADYVNRKGFHSLNVQMVCDARFRFTSVCANWPGSVHDSRIWRESSLCYQFERGEHNGFLLGDSGYPCRRYLLTPYLQPTGDHQNKYNAALCKTRVLVEQSFGVLKRRFACLQQTLRTNPNQAVGYVVACVILHNIGIDRGDIVDTPPVTGSSETDQVSFTANEGSRMRDYIAQRYFG